MKQDQKKYKQQQSRSTGSSAAALIPHEPEPPRPYKPRPSPCDKPMKYEWVEIAGLATIYLLIIFWLTSTPASGEKSYYSALLSGKVTATPDESPSNARTAGEGALETTQPHSSAPQGI